MLDFSFTPAQEEYRAVIGLKCVGAALQSVDETVEHARSRVVFGAPLAAHQGASFALADAATWLELARRQCYRVLWMRQQGIQCQSEGAIPRILAPGASLRERIVPAREEVTALEEADRPSPPGEPVADAVSAPPSEAEPPNRDAADRRSSTLKSSRLRPSGVLDIVRDSRTSA